VHDGQSALYLTFSGPDGLGIERIRFEGIVGLREPVATGYGGLLAVDGTRQLFVAGEEDYGYFYTELYSLDLATRGARALPAPDDGWEATALAYDPSGVLYVAEAHRQQIRKLVLGTGEIAEVVGRLGQRGVQLGPLPGGLNQPRGIAVLPGGKLAITDLRENVVLVTQ
jgi:hypothetical protein